MISLGVLPGSPPKLLRRSKSRAQRAALSSIANGDTSSTNLPVSVIDEDPSVNRSREPSEFRRGEGVLSVEKPSVNRSREPSEFRRGDGVLSIQSVNRSREPSEFRRGDGVLSIQSVGKLSREGSAIQTINHTLSRESSEFRQDGGFPTRLSLQNSSREGSSFTREAFTREASDIHMDIDSRGRSHHRSPLKRGSSRTSSSSLSRSRSPSEGHKHMKSAPFFNDIVPTGRPAIKDYSTVIRRRLMDTVFIYENWILSNDGFPDKELQYRWARDSWDVACRGASEQFKLSERMIKLVRFLLLFGFISSFANFFRLRLEDHAFAVISRTSSGRLFQVISNLV